ncbi:MAG TPA: hypothetical protein VMS17_18990 [Gemmataceae bacterium]|nr:hypothetical protein [Gemmataceae bacterium]
MASLVKRCGWATVLAVLAAAPSVRADDPVTMTEAIREGRIYRISTRVDLAGTLTPPADKGQPTPKPVSIKGDSAIDYDERLLTVKNGEVHKTIRLYSRIDFNKTLADRPSEGTLRPAVRRLVVMREKGTKAPFSPDGPLTWSEIDLVRTDIFTPALTGMLPDHAVQIGDRWTVTADAVRELTDLDHIDDGKIECRLEEIAPRDGRRQARVTFSGTVRGGDEDGPNRQQLVGWYLFDLESGYLSYIYLKGVHAMLDADGKEMGRVEGRYVLSRKADVTSRDLGDDALKGATLEPNDDDTRLLYDNPDLGVRFLYPRRWHIGAVRGSQVGLDGADGSGLLITVDTSARTPTGAQFLDESRSWLESKKVKVLRVEPVKTTALGLEHFALETEAADQKALMDYYVARQADGGATLAARLMPDDQEALRKEVEGIARSLAITKKIEERK